MTAPTPRGERPAARSLVPLPALTAVLSVAAVAAGVAAAPASVRGPLAAGTGAAAVVLVAAVFVAVRAVHTARAARGRLETVRQDTERLRWEGNRALEDARRERQHLIDELARQRAEFAQAGAQERARLEDTGAQELRRLTDDNARLAQDAERAARARDTAVSATSNAAGRMQALTTGMLADLRAMEERHTDEEVLADLLHLDHRTAQAGRLADSVAVLTGARSGRRWARPIAMESILRGALGRISAYRRVRVHAASDAAVAGHAAEGVMHALAELLDNAANFSPPTSEVHVYVEEVPAGIIVSVEDSGLVMGDVQLRRAEQAVSGGAAELGGLTGTRLGLAVVGRLARKHGLKVSFRPSARGGTGVLMLVPQDLLTAPVAAPGRPAGPPPKDAPREHEPAPSAEAGPVPADASVSASSPAPDRTPDGSDDDTAERPTGLPKRRRGRTLAEAEQARSAPRTPAQRAAPGSEDVKARAARFSSFRQAVRATASDPSPPSETAAADRPGDGAASRPETSGAPGAPADLTSHPYTHPEGDPTT
ncbi:ATP-binding protein [Streptomyces sp. NPDC046985]|uniref:sensor histidine kinase n=1 Tax=Streptomyces sp. NPDC046985 TaxID=3155377 RepID=UPI003401EA25